VKWNTISDHSYTGTNLASYGAFAAFAIIANDSWNFGSDPSGVRQVGVAFSGDNVEAEPAKPPATYTEEGTLT
jgi:hypothetical protein